MGMSEIFGEQANFTGINDQSNLHVSNMIQKAYISVNEVGSQVAAVTGNSAFFYSYHAIISCFGFDIFIF